MKILCLSILLPTISAFVIAPSSTCTQNQQQSTSTTLNANDSSRRVFLENSIISASIMGFSLPSIAEDAIDDLSMPSDEEVEAQAKADMEDRIRRKRELQKKASRPATFGDSLVKEKEKKAELKKSQDERRIALCEELGRGC
mmetsp:Transcript_15740/g.19190  ORF Transcript_15740/g.19190 Transcript_15740/m.19190 type:complete len:142 (+) Transcript_15740:265-690(+)